MCKTIKQKVRFRALPAQIYRFLADSKAHSALTGRKAKISQEAGGAFSTHGGEITGVNVDLAPGARLVQAWRSKDFPVGIFSMATFQLSRTPVGGTELVLTHRGVPKHLIPKVESFWKKNYWEKIRKKLAETMVLNSSDK